MIKDLVILIVLSVLYINLLLLLNAAGMDKFFNILISSFLFGSALRYLTTSFIYSIFALMILISAYYIFDNLLFLNIMSVSFMLGLLLIQMSENLKDCKVLQRKSS